MFTTTNNNTTTLTDDAPEWAMEMVYHAHAGEVPSEWIWSNVRSIWELLAEGADEDEMIANIDSLVDIYNGPLVAWLAEQPGRAAYCDEAVAEGLADGSDLMATLMAGQYVQLRDILAVVSEFYQDMMQEA